LSGPESEDQEQPAPRSRIGPALILLSAPLLFLSGIPGVHGGGFGTGAALFMSLLCVPVGVLTMIWGLSTRPRSSGWWFTRGYLLACGVAIALAWYDLAT
jgi:hypothetical protein